VEETLVALKDSKRVVELKFQNLLAEKERWARTVESLGQEADLLQVKNQSLEERLVSLQHERDDQTEILAEIQSSLVQRTSGHEAEVRRMQEELDRRLDEIIATKLEDVEAVKEHYVRLFNEKAAELMLVRGELDAREGELGSCQARCRDLEYREQELSDLVSRMRENPEHVVGHHEVKKKLADYEASTRQLAHRLKGVQEAFGVLKRQEAERVGTFARECEELRAELRLRDAQLRLRAAEDSKHEKESFSPFRGGKCGMTTDKTSDHDLELHGVVAKEKLPDLDRELNRVMASEKPPNLDPELHAVVAREKSHDPGLELNPVMTPKKPPDLDLELQTVMAAEKPPDLKLELHDMVAEEKPPDVDLDLPAVLADRDLRLQPVATVASLASDHETEVMTVASSVPGPDHKPQDEASTSVHVRSKRKKKRKSKL
jgi:hypothetical protein